MNKAVIGFMVALVAVFCAGQVQAADITITQFLPSSSTPRAGAWYLSDVRTGGTASITSLNGRGAAMLTTDMTDGAKAEVTTYGDFGLASDVLNRPPPQNSWVAR